MLGGTGFIGAAACKELMRRGIETVAASRREHPYGTFTSHVAFDRRDPDALKRAIDDVAPDVLLDLACYQPGEIADVMRTFRGARYVFVSTMVYPDSTSGEPAREDDFQPLAGAVPGTGLSYLDGKRWCETLLARQPEFPAVVIRPSAVLGPADPTLRIAAYLQRVGDGGPLLVPLETYRRRMLLAWVRDVGFACALACELARPVAGRAFNVGFESVTLADLLEGIGRAVGRAVEVVQVPYADLPEGASPYGPDPARPAGLSVDRARAELQFEPSQLEEALAETLAWYRVAAPSHPGYSRRPRELEIARTRG